MTIQIKASEQYVPVVLFIMLYKVVLTCDFVDDIRKCDHSNESNWAVLSCGAVYYMLYKVVLTCESVDDILSLTIQMKTTEQYFPAVVFSFQWEFSSRAWDWKNKENTEICHFSFVTIKICPCYQSNFFLLARTLVIAKQVKDK